jgi:hypothetical protein
MTQAEIVDLTGYPADRCCGSAPMPASAETEQNSAIASLGSGSSVFSSAAGISNWLDIASTWLRAAAARATSSGGAAVVLVVDEERLRLIEPAPTDRGSRDFPRIAVRNPRRPPRA